MKKIKKIVDKILEWLTIIIFSSMTILVSWQVFTRYVLSKPSPNSEIIARFLFAWLVFLGAAYVFGTREHMNIGFFKDKAKPVVQLALNIIIELLIFIFSASVLVAGGWQLATAGMAQMEPTLLIPMGYVFMVIPISGICTMFYNVCNIIDDLSEHKKTMEVK